MKFIAWKIVRVMTDNLDLEDRLMRHRSLCIVQTNFQHSMVVVVHEIQEFEKFATHGVHVLCTQEVYIVDGIVTGLGVYTYITTTTAFNKARKLNHAKIK